MLKTRRKLCCNITATAKLLDVVLARSKHSNYRKGFFWSLAQGLLMLPEHFKKFANCHDGEPSSCTERDSRLTDISSWTQNAWHFFWQCKKLDRDVLEASELRQSHHAAAVNTCRPGWDVLPESTASSALSIYLPELSFRLLARESFHLASLH